MTFSSIRPYALTALFVLFAAIATTDAAAQAPLNENERERALAEMKAYKHDFIAKELNLDKEQQSEFFPIYDEMDSKIMQINYETRELERSINEDKNASDTEIEAAAAAVFNQKEREGKIENEYFEKFKEVLTPRQLLRLKSAEKKFTQRLVRHHKRLRQR